MENLKNTKLKRKEIKSFKLKKKRILNFANFENLKN
jgi:hypothetical protein